MHTHQSLWKGGEPLFYDERGYGGLSDLARWYIGGLIEHAPSLVAFTNPTVNSFKRLVPGFEAPVNMVYSARNRSAAIRIPVTGSSAKSKRVEFRAPDPSANPRSEEHTSELQSHGNIVSRLMLYIHTRTSFYTI